jgi:hypothetical protein
MDFYGLLLGALATWRVTHLLNAEDGPWGLMANLRRALGNGFWGQLTDCFACTSLWVAFPLACATGHSWQERLFLWPSLSASAILLERLTKREPSAATYFEEEADDGVLRRSEGEGGAITHDGSGPGQPP